jgi:hypothetical protein
LLCVCAVAFCCGLQLFQLAGNKRHIQEVGNFGRLPKEKKKKNSKMAGKLGYSMTRAFKKQQHAAS